MGQVKRLGGESAVLFVKNEETKSLPRILRGKKWLWREEGDELEVGSASSSLVLGRHKVPVNYQRTKKMFLLVFIPIAIRNGDVRERHFNCRIRLAGLRAINSCRCTRDERFCHLFLNEKTQKLRTLTRKYQRDEETRRSSYNRG